MSTRRRNLFNGEVATNGFGATGVQGSEARGDVLFKQNNNSSNTIVLRDINFEGRGEFWDEDFIASFTPIGMCIFGRTELYIGPIFVSLYQFKLLASTGVTCYPIGNYASTNQNQTYLLYKPYFIPNGIKGTSTMNGILPLKNATAPYSNYSLSNIVGGSAGCPVKSSEYSHDYTDNCGNIHVYCRSDMIAPSLPTTCLDDTMVAGYTYGNEGHVTNVQNYLYQADASNEDYESNLLISSPTVLSGYLYRMWMPGHPNQVSGTFNTVTSAYNELESHPYLTGMYTGVPTLFELAAFSESTNVFDQIVVKLQPFYSELSTIASISSNYVSFVSCTPSGTKTLDSVGYYKLHPTTGAVEASFSITSQYTEAVVPFFTYPIFE